MADRSTYRASDIYSRQADIFVPANHQIEVHIVGVGATGSFDAMCLAKLGFDKMTIYDHDTVEVKNQAGQIYGLADHDRLKVDACAEIVERVADIEIRKIPERWEAQPLRGIVIMGLDSMEGRKAMFDACRRKLRVKLLLDHRIGGETIQILPVLPMNKESLDRYEETLFSDKEAAPVPCTQRSVIYQNFTVAGLTVNIIRNFLVHGEKIVPKEIIFNGRTMDYTIIK